MARYVFQDAFEQFIAALNDALLLDAEAGASITGSRMSEAQPAAVST